MIKPLPYIFQIVFFPALLSASLSSRSQCPAFNATATPAFQAICSGSSISPIVLSSSQPGTIFSWTRDNTSTVTGIAASGSGNISGTLTSTTNAPVPVTFTITPQTNQLINETFNSVLPAGWAQQNQSSPIGTQPNWFAGTAFPPYSPSGFIAANYNSTTPGGTVSNWLFTPTVYLKSGDQFSFYTRTAGPAAFPDRLQLRMSTNGANLNTGIGPFTVGDFTTLLMDINPTYAPTGYPTTWTQLTATLPAGLPAGITGRIAFRYFTVTGSTPGDNSAMVGIDDVVFTTLTLCIGTPITATVLVNPSPTVTISSNIPPPILPGQVMTLTAVVSPAGGTFVWYKDGVVVPGATSNTLGGITVNDLGNYTVTYTDPNGCVNTSAAFNVYARPSTNVYVYPNPNNGQFNIRFYNEPNEEVTVTVYDHLGLKVFQMKYQAGSQRYSIFSVQGQRFNTGNYFVEVVNSRGEKIGFKSISVLR